ncbi:hypothetical protein AnigIFM60653_010820 [Aspergillus niger]|nr:hypothetical protein AnigIFM56816_009694 [Aspergillus niger]GLA09016.1 hypothetical protein AnigIFM60653_010820 [Aspergillus niger]
MVEDTPQMHHPPSNPNVIREDLRVRGQVLAAALPPILNDPTAQNMADTQYAQRLGTNIAMMNILGNDDGNHQRVQFGILPVNNIPTGMPQVMTRRGVPRAMFEQDMNHIRDMTQQYSKDQNTEYCVMCLTCAISIFFWACCGGSAFDRYQSNLRVYLSGMNTRYAPFNITWETQFIPFGGTYISYET